MHQAVESYERAYATEEVSDIERLVGEAFTEDAILESPYLDHQVVGHPALVDHITRTRSMMADTTAVHTSPIERVGNTLRWTWAFEADGARLAEGMDVAVLSDDERIQRLVVFDGILPSA